MEGGTPGIGELIAVDWVDTTNMAAWMDLEEIAEFAHGGGWRCRNVGFLSYADTEAIVVSGRRAPFAEPPQYGLNERIPRCAIRMLQVVVAEVPDA